jgi:hypothetical protein
MKRFPVEYLHVNIRLKFVIKLEGAHFTQKDKGVRPTTRTGPLGIIGAKVVFGQL